MKKLLVVFGLSVVAMAGKCGSSAEKSETAGEKPAEEFPAGQEAAAPAQEVPSYDQQQGQAAPAEAAPGADQQGAPAPTEAAPAAEPSKAPSND